MDDLGTTARSQVQGDDKNSVAGEVASTRSEASIQAPLPNAPASATTQRGSVKEKAVSATPSRVRLMTPSKQDKEV
jgi:hypothetical protein